VEKKQAAWLDKSVRIVGLTLAGVIAFSLSAGVLSSMLRMYLGRKSREGEIEATARAQEPPEKLQIEDASDALEWLRAQLAALGAHYEASVRAGAIEAYMHLVANIGEVSKPSDIPVGKLLSAVKTGVLHAGTLLMAAGREQFGRLSDRSGEDGL
jgi:hypothetical protein